MQVSRNDTTLADALAKQEISKASAKLHAGAGHAVLRCNSVKEFVRRVDKLFADRIIDAAIGRPIGSRATASVIVVDTDTGGNLALTQLIFDAKYPHNERVRPHAVPIIVQQHAYARLIQRITGEQNLGKAVKAIQPHLHAAVGWVRANYPLEPRAELSVSGLGIEISGSVDSEGALRLKTVIDAACMQSNLRKAWALGERIEVRETYMPKVKGKTPSTVVLDEAPAT